MLKQKRPERREFTASRESVRHLPKMERLELLEAAEKHAMQLLSDPQHWQIIEQIAVKLLESESLDELSLAQLLPAAQNMSPYEAFHRYVQSL